MRRTQYLSDATAALTLVNALTATQDPLAGGVFGAVPTSWQNSNAGAIPEFDLTAWAAGTVTLTNVELFCAVPRAGTIAITALGAVNTGTDELTLNAHGLLTGDSVSLFTAGTMPAPLVASQTYYAIRVSVNVIKVALTRADALAGVAINLTSAGSGATETEAPQPGLMRWLSLGVVSTSLALALRRGLVVRVTGHQHAVAYAIGATWGAAVAATFQMVPVEER